MRLSLVALTCRRTILSFENTFFARDINFVILERFFWLFHPTLQAVYHPASLNLCRRHKSTIAWPIENGPSPESAHSVWSICTSYSFSFIHCKIRIVRSTREFGMTYCIWLLFSVRDDRQIGSGRLHSCKEFI
jgi:hypothetical protein